MGEQGIILVDGDIPVVLRRSPRARRMTLRVARAGGTVVLTLPMSASIAEGQAFARSRAEWLRQARAAAPALQVVEPEASFPVEGRLYRIKGAQVRSVRPEGEMLLVPAGGAAGVAVAAWLRNLARQRLVAACDRYAHQLGRPYRGISLRDTRTRWGSCTHSGRLMFSWRLAMAPPEVLDYVAAHEVAHLRHMDHSTAFWATTAGLMPDYQRHRQWLRENGTQLQAWVFGR